MKLMHLVLSLLLITGCNENKDVKPMKYSKNGIDLSCTGYYVKDELKKVICFSDKRDTILKEDYENDEIHGKSIQFYENGNVKVEGQYYHGWPTEIWKEYYSSGVLKSFRYYNPELDSFNLFYEKEYDESGELYSLRYPLKFRTNNDSGSFKVNNTYQLFIDLIYSEYDTVNSYGFINSDPISSVNTDTVSFEGKSIYLEFTPKQTGIHKISGTYIEVDGSKSDPKMGYGGEKEWSFVYEAIR
jgi:hypothetical protein